VTGALEVVDLASVEINQPQPWTPATLRFGRSHRTDVSRIVLLPGASVDLGRVSGVAAFRRPRLVAVLAVVPQPRLHPFGEGGQAVTVPLLQGITGEGVTGAAALIGQTAICAPGVDAAANTREWCRWPPRRTRRPATRQPRPATTTTAPGAAEYGKSPAPTVEAATAHPPKRGSAPGYRPRHDQVPGTPTPPTFPAPGKAAPTASKGRRGISGHR
jgi:hypothetical protein